MGLGEDDLRDMETRWLTEEGDDTAIDPVDALRDAEEDIRALLAEVRRLQARTTSRSKRSWPTWRKW